MHETKTGLKVHFRSAAIALLLPVLLTACTQTHALASNGGAATKTTSNEQAAPAKPTEGQLASLLVSELGNQCSGLSSFALDPANWLFTLAETGTAPYEMGISGGDGGAVVLLVTPNSAGGVSLSVSPEWADSTNALLWNSGCSNLAEAPAAPVDSGSNGGGETVVYTFELPDFSGATQNQVEDWFFSNGIKARPGFDYGFNPMVSCEVTGEGIVIGQSPGPGAVLDDLASSSVRFDIDCDW
jgi:hypothetical protein